jgi:phosphopantothenoylcysteine decarboxylase/phosphopantothenate--cysteine ligase
VIVAPAMDGGMYSHPATRANVERLREFGYAIVDPESGPLASGMIGQGRLATLSKIVDAVVEAVRRGPTRAPGEGGAPERAFGFHVPSSSRSDLAGRHVVVTAGGTAEPIDPVRFVGNRSSGKMGIAIAEEALDRGAAVTLVLGNVSVQPPAGAQVVRAETAAEMQSALRGLTPSEGPAFDVLVMAAAVADFRPRSPSDRKMSRADGMSLDLEATPDILAEVASRVRAAASIPGWLSPVLVGFAAETGSFDRAAAKLEAKGVDLLVANDVAEPGSGFGTDTNRVTLYAADGPREELPLMSKRKVAELLLDRVVARLAARVPANAPLAEERR